MPKVVMATPVFSKLYLRMEVEIIFLADFRCDLLEGMIQSLEEPRKCWIFFEPTYMRAPKQAAVFLPKKRKVDACVRTLRLDNEFLQRDHFRFV